MCLHILAVWQWYGRWHTGWDRWLQWGPPWIWYIGSDWERCVQFLFLYLARISDWLNFVQAVTYFTTIWSGSPISVLSERVCYIIPCSTSSLSLCGSRSTSRPCSMYLYCLTATVSLPWLWLVICCLNSGLPSSSTWIEDSLQSSVSSAHTGTMLLCVWSLLLCSCLCCLLGSCLTDGRILNVLLPGLR